MNRQPLVKEPLMKVQVFSDGGRANPIRGSAPTRPVEAPPKPLVLPEFRAQLHHWEQNEVYEKRESKVHLCEKGSPPFQCQLREHETSADIAGLKTRDRAGMPTTFFPPSLHDAVLL